MGTLSSPGVVAMGVQLVLAFGPATVNHRRTPYCIVLLMY